MIKKAKVSGIGVLVALGMTCFFSIVGFMLTSKIANDTAVIFGLLLIALGGLSIRRWPPRLDKDAMSDFNSIFDSPKIIALGLGSGMVVSILFESFF
jgi:hypothetical protein